MALFIVTISDNVPGFEPQAHTVTVRAATEAGAIAKVKRGGYNGGAWMETPTRTFTAREGS